MPKAKWVNMYLDLAITNIRIHFNRRKYLNSVVLILGKRKSLSILLKIEIQVLEHIKKKLMLEIYQHSKNTLQTSHLRNDY